MPSRTFYNLNRRISIRVGTVGAIFSYSANYLVHETGSIHTPVSAANTGFPLSTTAGVSNMISLWVRCSKSAETGAVWWSFASGSSSDYRNVQLGVNSGVRQRRTGAQANT